MIEKSIVSPDIEDDQNNQELVDTRGLMINWVDMPPRNQMFVKDRLVVELRVQEYNFGKMCYMASME